LNRQLPSVALLALVLVAASAVARAQTLASSVTLAVQNFPEVRAAMANQRAIGEGADQARSAWLPSIDATFGRGNETSNNVSTRALGNEQTLKRREAELNLTQLLFDGGVTSGQTRRFEARSQAADDQLSNTAETIAGRTAQAYVEVVRLRGLSQLANDNVVRHQQTLEQVTLLADSGRGRRADVQQAEARYAFAQSSLTQLRNQLVQAEAAYRHLVGQAPGALADPGDFATRLPPTLEAALPAAMDGHPAIRAAQKDLLAAQADRESARGRELAPRLTLELGTSANHNLDGVTGLSGDRTAMLRLRYNLYRGGADGSRIRESEARIDEALANVAKAKNDVERDLRQAWDGLREDRARLPQLGRYVAASNEVVLSYRAQFSIGQRTLLDVLNAENELFTAKSTLYSGLSAITAGELRVLAAMAKLRETLGISMAMNESPSADSSGAKVVSAEGAKP
jgi:adhesin transport system outer membrane protein